MSTYLVTILWKDGSVSTYHDYGQLAVVENIAKIRCAGLGWRSITVELQEQ